MKLQEYKSIFKEEIKFPNKDTKDTYLYWTGFDEGVDLLKQLVKNNNINTFIKKFKDQTAEFYDDDLMFSDTEEDRGLFKRIDWKFLANLLYNQYK